MQRKNDNQHEKKVQITVTRLLNQTYFMICIFLGSVVNFAIFQ